ncbi:MAG TPA: HAMP domain-containing sensor histidine kinase [Thermoanaerobaculia bacterium]|nr:HAMP domain-containing sensor histidine kinase [Thermoanaerobaculia bacterium]
MTFRRAQVRIPLAGALASLIFLAALALGTRAVVRRVTLADVDEELETLTVAIASDLELQGLRALEARPLHAGVESNTLVFRLERHSAIVVTGGRILAVAGDVRVSPAAHAVAMARRPEGAYTVVEPFSGQSWRARVRVAHLSGLARGATLIVFRSIEPQLTTLTNLDYALAAFVLLGVLGSLAILGFAVARALRPVVEVTRVAEAAEARDLSRRVQARSGGEEVQRLCEVINSLFDRLEGAFQSQRRLVADAAHELKTPVAVIMAEAQEARRSETEPTVRDELLASIERSARSLARETNDLLTLARGESPIEKPSPVDLDEVVAAAVDACARIAREHDVTVTLHPSGGVMVLGDAPAMERLALNLVTNAIHYSREHGDVEVRIEAEEREITLSVADRGPGISPDDRVRIFERFVRLPEARRHNPEGSGLGLAIVAQVVRNHAGSIDISDRQGGGSIFRVHLPRHS